MTKPEYEELDGKINLKPYDEEIFVAAIGAAESFVKGYIEEASSDISDIFEPHVKKAVNDIITSIARDDARIYFHELDAQKKPIFAFYLEMGGSDYVIWKFKFDDLIKDLSDEFIEPNDFFISMLESIKSDIDAAIEKRKSFED